MSIRRRAQVGIAYIAFIVIGISAGVGGVLLPAQVSDYGVSRATIGLTFFAFAAGFLLSGMISGPLVHRFGLRWTLVAGSTGAVLAGLVTAARPPFTGLLAAQILAGLGTGIAEAALNTHLAALPGASVLLGRLHAFFGVGALTGPPLAAWILTHAPWTTIALVTALAYVPVAAGVAITYDDDAGAGAEKRADGVPREKLLPAVARQPAVVLAALFLAVYVGLEVSIGNWGYSYLAEVHHQSPLAASNAAGSFWLGLTAGRFLIQPAAHRLRWDDQRVSTVCLTAIAVTAALVIAVPADALAVASLAVTGFLLGPLFPTTMAMMPMVTSPRYVATAIGLLNGVSSIGGSALPWLAGALAEAAGLRVLMPYVLVLAAVQIVLWRWLVRHRPAISDAPGALDAAGQVSAAAVLGMVVDSARPTAPGGTGGQEHQDGGLT